jgi:hypothetical protein
MLREVQIQASFIEFSTSGEFKEHQGSDCIHQLLVSSETPKYLLICSRYPIYEQRTVGVFLRIHGEIEIGIGVMERTEVAGGREQFPPH